MLLATEEERRHSEQVTTTYSESLRGIHSGLWSALPTCGRIGESPISYFILSRSCSGVYPPFWKKWSTSNPKGIVETMYSPLMAIVGI
jgi:hypothetical protein